MKLSTTLFLAATTATTIAATPAADIKPLIVGGTIVPTGQKTYTVGLRTTPTGSTFCGGSLISPTHVLSAAHCAGNAKFVAVGTHFLSGKSDGVQVAVKSETTFPFFMDDTQQYDYMIIELETPVTQFAPVKLLAADSETFVGATATTMGWGTTMSQGRQSNELLRVNVPVLSDVACKDAKLNPYRISSSMFCAGGRLNKDSCQGDSGGPLILEQASGDVLIGVVSWGEGCGYANKPGVYSKVSRVRDWIQELAHNATFVESV